jgi:hypothetical protein
MPVIILHIVDMKFSVELPYNTSFFPASPNGVYTKPIELTGIYQKWKLKILTRHAFKCDDIRKGLDGQMEYLINGMWYVLRQENGNNLELFQVTQILEVTFANHARVSSGKTKVPNAFWTLAENITGTGYASTIAEAFFANDIKAIQAARQKRGK